MWRTLLGLVAVFAAALGLVSLTFSAVREERADYVFVNGAEPKTLDPQRMTGQLEGRIAEALFEGLTALDAPTMKPVPAVATRWESDGTRWTFHLREDARWSNGDPVTAHDFVYAWKRLQEPETASEYAYLMHFVRHAEAYNTYAGHVKALRETVGALRSLVAARPAGLRARDWQAFAAERSLRDVVPRVSDATILAALAREDGAFTPKEGVALADALSAEGDRRAAALGDAHEHFGVDEGVFARDAHTFVVEHKAFTPYFLELTAFYVNFPVHRATVERHPEDWFLPAYIVSNGPFLLERWDVNRKIRLRKNPTYWDAPRIHLRTVDALPVTDRSTAFNLYETGEVDWLPASYPLQILDKVRDRPDFYVNEGMIVYYYRINCTRRPFNDPRVRRALATSFDRGEIVEHVTRRGETPATAIVAPGVPGYESPPSRMGHDVAGARRLLAEAGFPDGRGFPTFGILYNDDEVHRRIAEYVARQWKVNLGIEANALKQEWQAYQETTRRLDYDVARAGWIGDYRDPNTFLDLWITQGGNNQTGWGDPFYDRLIQLAADPLVVPSLPVAERESLLSRFRERPRAQAALDRWVAAGDDASRLAAAAEFRLHLFREAEAILLQDAFPVIPVYFYRVSGFVKPYVDGFYSYLQEDGRRIPNLQDQHPYRDVRILSPEDMARGARGRR